MLQMWVFLAMTVILQNATALDNTTVIYANDRKKIYHAVDLFMN